MNEVLAAGTVVLRHSHGRTEVAVVHRPKYKDWTLPKGKQEARESLPECAVRETREESGLEVRLDVPLDVVGYRLPRGDRKVVHYWRAAVVADHGHKRDDEIDGVRWINAEGALSRLNFARDRRAVRQAVALPTTTAVSLARHGKAMTRKRWHQLDAGPDVLRPVVRRGQEQARDLVGLLRAYGIADLRTSSATRCVQTLEPASKRLHLPLTTYEAFTEESGEPAPDVVAGLMEVMAGRAARDGHPLVVCGHRPVLPAMQRGLGVTPQWLGTGDLVVAHLAADGQPVAVEHHAARR